jgi:hypothetical protein
MEHTTDDRQPSYRDTQLGGLMKELRAAVRPYPPAKLALEKVEKRLKFNLRVVQQWDETHAERAELMLRLGNVGAANTEACLIFDEATRHALLRRATIGIDHEADERIAEAVLLEREVIE